MALSANVLYSIESRLGFIRPNLRNIFPKVNKQLIYIERVIYRWTKQLLKSLLKINIS